MEMLNIEAQALAIVALNNLIKSDYLERTNKEVEKNILEILQQEMYHLMDRNTKQAIMEKAWGLEA